jgi:hypothetical protein
MLVVITVRISVLFHYVNTYGISETGEMVSITLIQLFYVFLL